MKDKPKKKPKKKWTTSKKIVAICLGNGIAMAWCSYVLAFLGRDQIAESLSQTAITEIIGVVLVYSLKALLENLSKNNDWPDKVPKEEKIIETPKVKGFSSSEESDAVG